jgi:hypothetical protein
MDCALTSVGGYASHQSLDDVRSEKKKYNQGGERVETGSVSRP